ncbi:MAG: NADH-ubiquinone oxidoreductase chain M [Burkholderiaceae bacterium]|jgi:NADH-quinone oxidoreductase subunit M|nr:MAG: NADH-ubiquinone oxidoreductase chain M [Burkholderiaceae bacterium]
MGWLSLAIWVPILFGVVLLAFSRDRHVRLVRWIALIGAVISFLVTLPLYGGFKIGTPAMQFVESADWIPRFNINYHLGVDGISLWFVLLTAFITLIVVIGSWESITERVNQYMAAFLILSGLMNGVFCALDGMLFYVFFEATLIPMYLIIGVWGGPQKIYAAFKYFLYMLIGSLLMLITMIYLYVKSGGSFDLMTWYALPLSGLAQTLLFFGFFAAFAVKVPMWPVHTWLPDVHVEAPTGGSVILAAIMLKLGAYGFIRFAMPIAPDAAHEWAWLMIALSLIAVVYVGIVALVQPDMKRLVAYSSVAHMGFVTLGFFIFSDLGAAGGIVQMLSHGLVSAAMFLCIGVLYDRLHTREIAAYGGVINQMPKFAAFALLFAMANCGLPGTVGFVGEWMVILGSVGFHFWVGVAVASALIWGAGYTLWMYKRVYLGPVANDHVKTMPDINAREFLMLALLAVAVLYVGIYPKPMTDVMDASVTNLLQHLAASKLN